MGAVIYYSYVARGQWRSFEHVEAAHLSVYRLHMDIEDRSGGAVRMWLVNSGHTPATKVTVFAHFLTYSLTIPRGGIACRDALFEIGETAIPPGEDKFSIRLPAKCDASILQDVRDGKRGVALTGVIRYENGFGARTDTGLCFFYQRDRPEWGRCTPRVNYTDDADLERQLKEAERQLKELESKNKAGDR